MPDNGNFIDEDKIPENLEPVEAAAQIPGRVPAAPMPHDMPQFFSGSMPPSLQHDVSFVGTEVGTPRIPKYSLMPFGNQSNPFTNAASQSTTIQAPPPSGSSSPLVSLSIPNIFTPTLQTESSTGLLAFTLVSQPMHYVFAGGSGTILDFIDDVETATANTAAISISGTSTQANDFGLVFTAQDSGGGVLFAPTGWTLAINPSGHQSVYYESVSAAGAVAATGTGDPAFPAWCSLLGLFATNGSTPVVANTHTIQSGAFNSFTGSIGFTPTAGNSLFIVIFSSSTSTFGGPKSVTTLFDNHGDPWEPIGSVANNGGSGVQAIVYGVSNITGGATNVTITLSGNVAAGNICSLEITNLAAISGILPKFRPLVGGDIPPINLGITNANGGVTGVLGPGSLPADIAYVDVANTFTQTQNFAPTSSVPPAIFFGQFSTTSQFSQFANLYVRYDLFQGGLTTPWTNYSFVVGGTSTFPALGIALKAGATGNAIDAYAPGSASVKNFSLSAGGLFSAYAGIATVAQGAPAEYAQANPVAQSAAIAATTIYAVPTSGMYRISWSAAITTADGVSSTLGGANGFQVVYTSPTDSVVKTTVPQAGWSSAGNTTGTAVGGTAVVYAKTGTNIQYSFGYTSNTPGQMVYELHIILEAL